MVLRLCYILILAFIFTSCTGQEARRPVQNRSGSFIKESAERNKALYDQEREFIEGIIAKDSSRAYYTSDKGFWYYYNKRDSTKTETPKTGDVVEFNYNITDFSGHTILSEKENGIQRYKVDQTHQELISGVREGIKLMKEGEKVTFLFPSYKAYGYYGIEDKLGTNVPVQSTITLHTIKHVKEEKD